MSELFNKLAIEHVAKVGDRLTAAQEKSSIHLIKWLMTEYKILKEIWLFRPDYAGLRPRRSKTLSYQCL
jgi:hypothetical protein